MPGTELGSAVYNTSASYSDSLIYNYITELLRTVPIVAISSQSFLKAHWEGTDVAQILLLMVPT